MRAALPLLVATVLAIVGWYQASMLEGRIAELESRGAKPATEEGAPTADERLTTVETTLKSLSESFFTQATDVTAMKQQLEHARKANIDLEEKTFVRVDTQLGPLFLQAENVRRKPEETAVDILIGNPAAATFVNATLRCRWGRIYDPNTDYQLWQDGLKEKEFVVKDPLRPGAWSRYTIHLETGPATQVGFLEVSIDTKTVLLQDVATPTPTTTLPRPKPTTPTTLPPARVPPPSANDDEERKPEPDSGIFDVVPSTTTPPTIVTPPKPKAPAARPAVPRLEKPARQRVVLPAPSTP